MTWEEKYRTPNTPWDWFHINAVHLDTDGNLLVDSRNTWTTFKVNRHTGQIMSDDQPEGQIAQAMGNAQTTPGGNLFVGWGALPYTSEFSPSGKLLLNAKLPAGVSTYRAYLLPWNPTSRTAGTHLSAAIAEHL
jgi:Arylsulfotransferase (ASST)